MALTQILVLKSLLSNFSAYDAGSSCGAGITSSMSMAIIWSLMESIVGCELKFLPGRYMASNRGVHFLELPDLHGSRLCTYTGACAGCAYDNKVCRIGRNHHSFASSCVLVGLCLLST